MPHSLITTELPIRYARRRLYGGGLADVEQMVQLDGCWYPLSYLRTIPGIPESQLEFYDLMPDTFNRPCG